MSDAVALDGVFISNWASDSTQETGIDEGDKAMNRLSRGIIAVLNWFATPIGRVAEFWNSHVEGEQPWKWWQR